MSNSVASPIFSVIIPTYNRPKLLQSCLESVQTQSFPLEGYEIIVVDDGSRKSVRHLVQKPMRYIRQDKQQGWAAARLAGAYVSRGHILAFLDDDCVAPSHWLATYHKAYQQYQHASGIAGGLRPGSRTNIAGLKQYQGHLDYFLRLNPHAQLDCPGPIQFSFGGNRTFKKDAWLIAQPKQIMWYADDYTIDEQLREHGIIVFYEPKAWVQHYYYLGLRQRLLSAYRYGRSSIPLTARSSSRTIGLHNHWKQLKQEFPDKPPSERLWYLVTQVLVLLARKWGEAYH